MAAFAALAENLPAARNSHWASASFWARSIAIWGAGADAASFFRAALDQADQEPSRLSKQMVEVLTQVRLVMIEVLREQQDF